MKRMALGYSGKIARDADTWLWSQIASACQHLRYLDRHQNDMLEPLHARQDVVLDNRGTCTPTAESFAHERVSRSAGLERP